MNPLKFTWKIKPYFLEDRSKKLKCLLQFLFGTLRVKVWLCSFSEQSWYKLNNNSCFHLLFSPVAQYSYNSDWPVRGLFYCYLFRLLSTPMGVDYVVIGFDMEVQPLVTHNAAWLNAWVYLHRCHKQSCAIRAYAMSAVGIDVVRDHKGREHC